MTNRKTANGDGSINNGTAQSSEIGQTHKIGYKAWRDSFRDMHDEDDSVRIGISELSENFPTNLEDINFVMAAEEALADQHHYHMERDYDEEEMAKIRVLHKSFRELKYAMLSEIKCRKELSNGNG